MKKISCLIILLFTSALLLNISWAEEIEPKSLEAVEFFTGSGWGELREKQDYHLNPFLVDFNLNLKPLIQKLNFNPRPLLQLQIEPFVSFVSQPDNNVEIGTSFLFKLGILPQTSKFQPFILAGLGMVYMTQHTREQSTQFNFIEQAGLGIHYFFRKNIAFTLEGRLRHLSNASMEHPNKGINTQFILAGILYQI